MADGSAVGTWSLAIAGPRRWTVRVVEPDARAGASSAPDRRSFGQGGSFDDLDDASLVAACLEGERAAFDVIVARHRRTVYQVCYRFAGNHEDASDLSQEAFVRAWRGLKTFKGESALATWLYRITVNACLNRANVKRPEMEPLEADRLVDQYAEAPGEDLIRGERALAVRRAIAELPERQRATLILRVYQELSHKQIAEILGSSVGAVKANFFHALKNLKKTLGSEP